MPKANVSQFGAGLTLDFTYRPYKVIDQAKNNASQIRFEGPTDAEIRAQHERHNRSRSRSPYSQQSRDIRDPILGLVTRQDGQAATLTEPLPSGRKQITFQPSEQLRKHNTKAMYLCTAEMKPLKELQQSRKTASTLDFANTSQSTRSHTPSKRTFASRNNHQEIKSVLSYKDALPYRDQGMTGKVSHTSHKLLVDHTMRQAIKAHREGRPKMTKASELKGNIL